MPSTHTNVKLETNTDEYGNMTLTDTSSHLQHITQDGMPDMCSQSHNESSALEALAAFATTASGSTASVSSGPGENSDDDSECTIVYDNIGKHTYDSTIRSRDGGSGQSGAAQSSNAHLRYHAPRFAPCTVEHCDQHAVYGSRKVNGITVSTRCNAHATADDKIRGRGACFLCIRCHSFAHFQIGKAGYPIWCSAHKEVGEHVIESRYRFCDALNCLERAKFRSLVRVDHNSHAFSHGTRYDYYCAQHGKDLYLAGSLIACVTGGVCVFPDCFDRNPKHGSLDDVNKVFCRKHAAATKFDMFIAFGATVTWDHKQNRFVISPSLSLPVPGFLAQSAGVSQLDHRPEFSSSSKMACQTLQTPRVVPSMTHSQHLADIHSAIDSLVEVSTTSGQSTQSSENSQDSSDAGTSVHNGDADNLSTCSRDAEPSLDEDAPGDSPNPRVLLCEIKDCGAIAHYGRREVNGQFFLTRCSQHSDASNPQWHTTQFLCLKCDSTAYFRVGKTGDPLWCRLHKKADRNVFRVCSRYRVCDKDECLEYAKFRPIATPTNPTNCQNRYCELHGQELFVEGRAMPISGAACLYPSCTKYPAYGKIDDVARIFCKRHESTTKAMLIEMHRASLNNHPRQTSSLSGSMEDEGADLTVRAKPTLTASHWKRRRSSEMTSNAIVPGEHDVDLVLAQEPPAKRACLVEVLQRDEAPSRPLPYMMDMNPTYSTTAMEVSPTFDTVTHKKDGFTKLLSLFDTSATDLCKFIITDPDIVHESQSTSKVRDRIAKLQHALSFCAFTASQNQ